MMFGCPNTTNHCSSSIS